MTATEDGKKEKGASLLWWVLIKARKREEGGFIVPAQEVRGHLELRFFFF